MNTSVIAALDDGTVLGILSEATIELGDAQPVGQRNRVGTAEEARELVYHLLRSGGIADASARLSHLESADTARALLAQMLEERLTRAVVEPIVEHPPADQQKSVELASAGAIILGGLIAWLQTKIDIQVTRADGKTEFSFKLRKEAAGIDVVKQVARQVGGMLGGGP